MPTMTIGPKSCLVVVTILLGYFATVSSARTAYDQPIGDCAIVELQFYVPLGDAEIQRLLEEPQYASFSARLEEFTRLFGTTSAPDLAAIGASEQFEALCSEALKHGADGRNLLMSIVATDESNSAWGILSRTLTLDFALTPFTPLAAVAGFFGESLAALAVTDKVRKAYQVMAGARVALAEARLAIVALLDGTSDAVALAAARAARDVALKAFRNAMNDLRRQWWAKAGQLTVLTAAAVDHAEQLEQMFLEFIGLADQQCEDMQNPNCADQALILSDLSRAVGGAMSANELEEMRLLLELN